MITGFSSSMLRLSIHFERGVMPVAGGLLDQPNIVIQAMDVIRARRGHNQGKRKSDG